MSQSLAVRSALFPGIVRLIAPNPSAMTGQGTNSYVVGQDRLTVIDPGPVDPRHLAALLDVIGGRKVDRIVVTHSHLDHSALAPMLSRACGAGIVGYGDSTAGRSSVMQRLAAGGLRGGGEGNDAGFWPDQTVSDGDMIPTDIGPLEVLHTPGHFGNHICLRLADAIFSGDHVMGWATSIISPPDGDLGDYMASLDRIRAQGAHLLLPGHGAPVTNPADRINWLIAHRLDRERQITDALQTEPTTVAGLTRLIYAQTPAAMHGAAARNVFAHLVDLQRRNIVTAYPELSEDAIFGLI